MAELPVGTVTFLFTDVEGSTRRWEDDDAAARADMADLDATVGDVVAQHAGTVVRPRGEGDSHFCVFARASDAVGAAHALQQVTPLPLRIAVHTGEADLRDGDYYGTSVNRAARLRALAHGRQVLVSQTTADLVGRHLPPTTSLVDRGLHQMKDLASPERVFELRWPDSREHPPLRSLDHLPTNLPPQRTSLIGREREIEEVRERLRTASLVTLTGSAGCGKTRLAIQVAAEAIDDHAAGAWLVELAPVVDADVVRAAVAVALRVGGGSPSGAGVESPEDVAARLIDHLRPLDLLLVLDNCEHVVDATAVLVDEILAECPRVHVIATSREPLGVAGEATYRVPNLTVPSEGDSAEEIGDHTAVHLFVDRARLADPGFSLTPDTASVVARVCRQLDGIPLAIELAAARAHTLGIQELALRLDDMFRVLKGGSRTALARQQTLQAAVDWSYDLLTPVEQAVLRRVAVFVGTFSLAAAEFVCSGPDDSQSGVDEREVVDAITSLVDKSLLEVEHGEDAMRYRLLEAVRQYGAERVRLAGEMEDTRHRHLAFFTELVARAGDEIRRLGPDRWRRPLRVDLGNLRSAMEWAMATGDLRAAVTILTEPMGRPFTTADLSGWTDFLLAQPLPAELRGAVLAAAALSDAAPPTPVDRGYASEALGVAATLSPQPWWVIPAHVAVRMHAIFGLGEQARAREASTSLRNAARELGLPGIEALATAGIAFDLALAGNHADAGPLLEDALAVVRELGSVEWLARVNISRAWAARAAGDSETEVRAHQEVVEACRASGDTEALSVALNLLAFAHIDDNPAKALAFAEEGIALGRRSSNRGYLSMVIHTAGEALANLGEWPAAREHFLEGFGIVQDNEPGLFAEVVDGLAFAERMLGNLAPALEHERAALALRRERESRTGLLRSLRRYGELASVTGDHKRAARLFGAYERLRGEIVGPAIHAEAYEAPVYEADVAATLAALGQDVYDGLAAEGSAMSLDEAVAFAAGEGDPSSS